MQRYDPQRYRVRRSTLVPSCEWPVGIDAALCLTFDLDVETMYTSRDERNANRPAVVSTSRFDVETGLGLVLDLLARHGVRTTFFMTAKPLAGYRDVAQEILARGHEIAHHGFDHRNLADASPAEERDDFLRARDLVEDALGVRLVGYRAPYGAVTPHTAELLSEQGFLYSSNMSGRVHPYRYGSDLVEIPGHFMLDDGPYFFVTSDPPNYRQNYPPSAVAEIWESEMNGITALGGATVLTLHPQLIGRPSRVGILDHLLELASAHGGIWMPRLRDVGSWFSSTKTRTVHYHQGKDHASKIVGGSS